MLRDYHFDNVRKYTFIDGVKRVGLHYNIHYTNAGKQLFKKIHIRSGMSVIQDKIKEIKKEIGVDLYGQAKDKIYIIGRD